MPADHEIGEEYRLLDHDERIREGDEMYLGTSITHPTGWYDVFNDVGRVALDLQYAIRRKASIPRDNPPAQRCENCRYHRHSGYGWTGLCGRHAPVAYFHEFTSQERHLSCRSEKGEMRTFQPSTHLYFWCGDYEPQPCNQSPTEQPS
jgi:hypothetical protein